MEAEVELQVEAEVELDDLEMASEMVGTEARAGFQSLAEPESLVESYVDAEAVTVCD